MSSAKITHELPTPPVAAPPLDRALFRPSEEELSFLRSAVSPDEDTLREKLFKVQERAYQEYPYPCIRAFHFIALMMRQNPIYAEVVERGKSGDALLLDLGCCMGTDVRNLMKDGYPGDHIIGCDLRDNYIKLGYELYNDKETCPITFITGDMFMIEPIFTPEAPAPLGTVSKLTDLMGQLTHIYTGALFHLFDEPTQKAITMRLASLWKREKGAVIFGRHQGMVEAGMIDDHLGRSRYGHSPASWEVMWKEVMEELEGEGAGNKIRVQAEVLMGLSGIPHANRQLVWSVQRM